MNNENNINEKTAGLIIDNGGNVKVMNDKDYHRTFLSNVLSNEAGMKISEDNLAYLAEELVNDYKYIVYFGCTEGDRIYGEGNFFIPKLDEISDNQYKSLLDVYSKISSTYKSNITELKSNTEISIGEVYEYMLSNQKAI